MQRGQWPRYTHDQIIQSDLYKAILEFLEKEDINWNAMYKRKTKIFKVDNKGKITGRHFDNIIMDDLVKKFTRDDYLKRFSELTAQMLETTRKKNNDYGGHTNPFKNFKRHGAYGVLVRLDDKYARLESVIKEGRTLQVADETILDTLIDIANYALILRIMLEQKVDKE